MQQKTEIIEIGVPDYSYSRYQGVVTAGMMEIGDRVTIVERSRTPSAGRSSCARIYIWVNYRMTEGHSKTCVKLHGFLIWEFRGKKKTISLTAGVS